MWHAPRTGISLRGYLFRGGAIAIRKIGDRLSFWGALGTQSVMPFGAPDDVHETVKRLIDKVGYNGGLLIAPTHVLEPEVPWANIDAFVETVHEYGRL